MLWADPCVKPRYKNSVARRYLPRLSESVTCHVLLGDDCDGNSTDNVSAQAELERIDQRIASTVQSVASAEAARLNQAEFVFLPYKGIQLVQLDEVAGTDSSTRQHTCPVSGELTPCNVRAALRWLNNNHLHRFMACIGFGSSAG